ncbi:MAG: tetratricopeptide repeat protein, partial [Nannocystaceae bacterium]|nr:tetratricopeptide repeat protein [Nannocystaceae bacterium]
AATLATAAGLEAESAEALIELASVLRQRGQADEAERLLDYAAGLVTRLQLWHLGPALALVQGKVAIDQGKPSVALSKYYRAIKLESNRIDAHPLRLVPMWIDLGRLLIAQGDPTTAATHFGDALTILEQTLGPQHPMIAETLVELASAQAAMDDGSKVIISLRRAVDVRRQVDDPASLGMVQLRLGDALLTHDSPALAIMRFTDAEASFANGALPIRRAEAIFGRGLAELAQGADAAAAETLTRAVTRTEALEDALALADARFALARALWHDPTQHTRALSLAALAGQAYAGAGPESADSRTAVREWAAAQTQPQTQTGSELSQTPDPEGPKPDKPAKSPPDGRQETKP